MQLKEVSLKILIFNKEAINTKNAGRSSMLELRIENRKFNITAENNSRFGLIISMQVAEVDRIACDIIHLPKVSLIIL